MKIKDNERIIQIIPAPKGLTTIYPDTADNREKYCEFPVVCLALMGDDEYQSIAMMDMTSDGMIEEASSDLLMVRMDGIRIEKQDILNSLKSYWERHDKRLAAKKK